MKSAVLNSLKLFTLTTALTGVVMASIAQAAIITVPSDDTYIAQQILEGQLYAAVKSDRDGTPDDDDNHSNDDRDDDGNGQNNDGHDNNDDDDNDDGDDSDGDDSDGDGDSDSDGDD